MQSDVVSDERLAEFIGECEAIEKAFPTKFSREITSMARELQTLRTQAASARAEIVERYNRGILDARKEVEGFLSDAERVDPDSHAARLLGAVRDSITELEALSLSPAPSSSGEGK